MDKPTATPPATKTRNSSPSVWFWLSAGSVVLSYLIGFVLLVFVVPVFVEMFTDLEAALPKPTILVLSLSNLIKSYFIFMALPLLGFTALCTWVLYELDKRKHIVIVIILGNVPPAIVIIMLIASFLPLITISRVLMEN